MGILLSKIISKRPSTTHYTHTQDPLLMLHTYTRPSTTHYTHTQDNLLHITHIHKTLYYTLHTYTRPSTKIQICYHIQILVSQHECVIMGDFNLPNIYKTLERPTPAPGNKLMKLLADNNLTQHVHETTRQNNILDLVISTEETNCKPENNRQNW